MSKNLAAHIKRQHPSDYKTEPGMLTTEQARYYIAHETRLAHYRPNFVKRCTKHGVTPAIQGKRGGVPSYYSVSDLDTMCEAINAEVEVTE